MKLYLKTFTEHQKLIKLMKTKYCLKSTVSFIDINQSPVNNSKSKQTFSFSKSNRFETIQPNCPKNTYTQNVLSRKDSGISIGKGKRSDFTHNPSVSPGVSKYKIKSFLQQNDKKRQGYSLRMSREEVNFGNYLSKELISVPAPNRYNNENKQRTKSPSFSIRPRTRILNKSMTIEPQNDNPGPGQYENPEIKNNSKYASKFSTIGYTSSRSKRFGNDDNFVPGPGNYKEISNLSKVGKYVLSNHAGGTKAIFDHQKRITKFDRIKSQAMERPGPGYYRLPSDFGHYDGDVYQNKNNNRTLNTSRFSKRVSSRRD